MGYPDEEARGALRLSLGRTTTDAEIDRGVATSSRESSRAMRRRTIAARSRPIGPRLGQGVPA